MPIPFGAGLLRRLAADAQRAHAPRRFLRCWPTSYRADRDHELKATQFSAGQLNVYPHTARGGRSHSRAAPYRSPGDAGAHHGCLARRASGPGACGQTGSGGGGLVSIFVNPLQFGAGEDLDAYPRTLDDDLDLLRDEGVEVAFTPPRRPCTRPGRAPASTPDRFGAELEGDSRPTHFAGC